MFNVFDYRMFLDVSSDELQRRLLARWVDLDTDVAKARQRVTDNDMQKVDRVLTRSARADIVVGN